MLPPLVPLVFVVIIVFCCVYCFTVSPMGQMSDDGSPVAMEEPQLLTSKELQPILLQDGQ